MPLAQRIDAMPPVAIAMSALAAVLLTVLVALLRVRHMRKRVEQLEARWTTIMTSKPSGSAENASGSMMEVVSIQHLRDRE